MSCHEELVRLFPAIHDTEGTGSFEADIGPVDEGFLKTEQGKGFAFVGPSFTDPAYFGEGAGIAVRKGDKALLDKLNAAILALRANGEYQKIQSKYFSFDIYGE